MVERPKIYFCNVWIFPIRCFVEATHFLVGYLPTIAIPSSLSCSFPTSHSFFISESSLVFSIVLGFQGVLSITFLPMPSSLLEVTGVMGLVIIVDLHGFV